MSKLTSQRHSKHTFQGVPFSQACPYARYAAMYHPPLLTHLLRVQQPQQHGAAALELRRQRRRGRGGPAAATAASPPARRGGLVRQEVVQRLLQGTRGRGIRVAVLQRACSACSTYAALW